MTGDESESRGLLDSIVFGATTPQADRFVQFGLYATLAAMAWTLVMVHVLHSDNLVLWAPAGLIANFVFPIWAIVVLVRQVERWTSLEDLDGE